MSTYSANQFNWKTMEVFPEHLHTPIKSAQGGSPCSRSDCPSCTGPATNSHVRDLTDDLEVKLVKLTAPPNHWIINITKAFKEAIQNQDTNELEIVKDLYQWHLDAVTIEDLVYDRTEIKQLNHDATHRQFQQTYHPFQPLDRLPCRMLQGGHPGTRYR